MAGLMQAIDPWADWLLHRRNGGDAQQESTIRIAVDQFRDKVLDGAELLPGMRLVDVGSGDGVIAFGAIERVGPTLQVVLVDISATLLRRAEELARSRGIGDQCSFLQASAERLDSIGDRSVDGVTTRAALAYVVDKAAAVREFFRVLKPGGRLSMAEPIFQDAALQLAALTSALAAAPEHMPQLSNTRLLQRCKAEQFPSTKAAILANPLTQFCERDLIALCQQAGFVELHLELHIDVKKSPRVAWDTYIDTAPFPGAPTLRETMGAKFSPRETLAFEQHYRPLNEAGALLSRDATAYLVAVKPTS